MSINAIRYSLRSCFVVLFVGITLLAPTMVQAQPTPAATSIAEDALASFLADSSHLIVQSDGKNHPFKIELADDETSRSKGLMYRTKIAPDYGMLFDFGEVRSIYMWMKNTYVSLDMLFINEDGTIHHLVEATTPLSESIIGSGGPVRYVLEVKKGTAERIGVKPGDRLLHQLFTPK